MLTVRDIAANPSLALTVAAGRAGLDREVTWLHVSELADPTPFLEGGECLLTTGLSLGGGDQSQREYVRRLARHGLSGLGFGIGFGFEDVPSALAEEADALDFPVLCVPYEVPFVAITKAAAAQLANDQLGRVTRALEVHERLSDAVLEGRGVDALLGIVCAHLGCSAALVDDEGGVVSERHVGRRIPFDDGLELPVVAGDQRATLKVKREGRPFEEYDRLVLHHGQTAIAFELSRRRAVSAAELRLAGDLLDDLEQDRLDDRDASRRIAAFGLDPDAQYAALLVTAGNGSTDEDVRRRVAERLERRSLPYLSTLRPGRAAFLVAVDGEEELFALGRELVDEEPGTRVALGRPSARAGLGRTLVEARAAFAAVETQVASYRDLGSLELLLALPDAALEAFVERVLGEALRRPALVESLAALLESGCRWSLAAQRLGVHRHTLRYRMDRLAELTGRHPDDSQQRMELWLAVKATQVLASHGWRPA